MKNYVDKIIDSYYGYFNYLFSELTFQYDYKPWWQNYFYALIIISAFFFCLEWFMPWRKNQPKFRQDFWLDFFYMFFNFFLFSLIIYNALSDFFVLLFSDALAWVGISNLLAINIQSFPVWLHFIVLFVLRDFIQWNTHILLHRVPFLWEFHKVHHSVQQMGFAAHLRYHWFENIVYRFIEYIPLAMLGYNLVDFFIVHIFTLSIGHFNHSNIKVPLGWLKYVFNNPQMHIWHHARDLPQQRRFGVNFGLTLSFWDYIFQTSFIPADGKDIPLGFDEVDDFPKDFLKQNMHGLSRIPAREKVGD